MSWLLYLVLVPFISSLVLLATPSKRLRAMSFLLSLAPLGILVYGYPTTPLLVADWIPVFSVQFILKMDSLSYIFIFLTTLIVPISLLAADHKEQSKYFFSLVMLLEGLLIGFFLSGDLVIFTFFWEAMLIPVYLLIHNWGREKREKAAMKFLIYTIAGSTLMIAAVLSIYLISGTFTIDLLTASLSKTPYSLYLCIIFLLAFAVKTPLFPFHAWAPDAYCESSTPITILLSALLSKAGLYGLLRVGVPLFSNEFKTLSFVLLILSLIGVLYAGFAAWQQSDFKRLIAYSSLSHVNFILAGIFVQNEISISGAILQSFNHGVSVAALFLSAGWLEKRIGTTSLNKVSGLCLYMPKLCWITFFFVLSSIALPGLNNFVGEMLILFGFFENFPLFLPLLGFTTILSALYMLRWMQKMYFENASPFENNFKDLGKKELLMALPLVLLILIPGIYPSKLLVQTEIATQKITETKDYP